MGAGKGTWTSSAEMNERNLLPLEAVAELIDRPTNARLLANSIPHLYPGQCHAIRQSSMSARHFAQIEAIAEDD